MPTNREIFFSLLNKKNQYLTRLVIKSLLNDVNEIFDDISLYKKFDEDCKNYDLLVSYVERVEQGEPYQYVLGYANFIDKIYFVDKNVLIPRQETEELVIRMRKYIEKYYLNKDFIMADVCTGSGVIGISLNKYFPKAKVYASDIDEKCLEIAIKNDKIINNSNITFLQGNLLEPFIEKGIKIDVLVCNPPYIADESTVAEQTLEYEPHLALFANPNTKYYEEIFKSASRVMNDNFIMGFEIGEDMEDSLSILVENYFPNAAYIIAKDMYKKTRFLFIINREDMNYA